MLRPLFASIFRRSTTRRGKTRSAKTCSVTQGAKVTTLMRMPRLSMRSLNQMATARVASHGSKQRARVASHDSKQRARVASHGSKQRAAWRGCNSTTCTVQSMHQPAPSNA